ncbi:MAG: methionine synthase [Pseudomonadota bacterium]
MASFLDVAQHRVLLFDGGMGTQIQAADLEVERDFWNQENCSEILNLSRPDFVREVHRTYLAAGAEAVETNTFGGSPITLGEFDLTDKTLEINRRAAELAREAIETFPADRPRFVVGSIGPGTRLASLGQVPYRVLEDAFALQAQGLIDGGVDAFLVETCQDTLQVKAAVNGCRRALRDANVSETDRPIMVQVTVETTGTLLVGPDITAAAAVVDALDVPSLGLNCATGPREMAEHVRYLGQNWSGLISIQPNAGLPELVEGKTHYPLTPKELAGWLERFVLEDGVAMVGGCCGTTGEHIAAIDAMLRRLADGGDRPRLAPRSVTRTPQVASLYSAVPLRQENAYLAIGERCNANGSRKFRELQEAQDWDGCVAMAREQVKEASHTLDVCTAFVGRDEVADMTAVVGRLRGAVDAPLVIDSTEYPVLEAALELYGGKAIINSINFEDGEEPAKKRLELAKVHGSAVVALTIDEEGMAKEAARKVEIADRLIRFAGEGFGVPVHDMLIDPLTFTICTGNADDRKLAIETLDGIEQIAERHPEVQLILGLSNVSFGLNAAARHVLNSVFLDEALKRGLTGAIVHVSKIMPLHAIPAEEVEAALDLIYDRWQGDRDPLQHFMALFADRKAAAKVKKERPEAVEERLQERIVDGDRIGLEADLDEAMAKMPPLDIINVHLLAGMKVVGDLFGAGKMQLPFVLQSAETMKAAVAHLEPHMEKVEGQEKGTIIIATVKGDVHDIGKNLVDIILTNNGYRVINLGIKQPLNAILEAYDQHGAQAIGMSGLLVKSTVIMRENLEEMRRLGHEVPVILGGAALTRAYVEDDCAVAYGDGRPVVYARDAFDGLKIMDTVVANELDGFLEAERDKRKGRTSSKKHRTLTVVDDQAAMRPVDAAETKVRRDELAVGVDVPEPPFWGPKLLEYVVPKALVPYLNENMLYQFHWGYKKDGRTLSEFTKWAQKELRPILADLIAETDRDKVFKPQAVYGYWPAAAQGNDVILFRPGTDEEVARFKLPRQAREGGLCIADFLRDVDSGERDVLGLQVVTVGQHASEVAREWFAADRYNDYVRLHGLGVELAEALAEYVHKRIRADLGFAHEDERDVQALIKQGYRGSRYSFGYPACPNMADQRILLDLLDASRIGLEMSEGDQLHPEQSTSAIVLHHPQARYFNV